MDLKLAQTVHTRALQRAAELLGGNGALQRFLGVTPVKLGIWMKGAVALPDAVFLQVVDLLLEHEGTILTDGKINGRHGDTDQASQA